MNEVIEVVAADPKRECEEGWRVSLYEYNEKAGKCQLSPWPFILGGLLLFGIVVISK